LALYDPRDLEFAYVTRMTAEQAAQTRLWQARGNYANREVAGLPFYLRVDPESGRTVAFAAVNGYLMVATRDDLLARMLRLLAGEDVANVGGETWFTSAATASEQGELRMVLN